MILPATKKKVFCDGCAKKVEDISPVPNEAWVEVRYGFHSPTALHFCPDCYAVKPLPFFFGA